MQNLDNDMDELFREAAENYPLRITGADWNKVQAALLHEQTIIISKTKKRWLWALLLLLIPFICSKLQNKNYEAATIFTTAKNSTQLAGQLNSKPIQLLNNSTVDQSENLLNNNNANTSSRINFLLAPITVKPYNRSIVQSTGNDAIEPFNNATIKPFTTSSKTKTIITAPATEEESNNEITEPLNNKAIEQLNHSTKDSAIEQLNNKTIRKEEPELKEKNTSESKQQKRTARLYINALAGPAISKVKNSPFEKPGITAGVSVGYNINKRFAIEAGAFWSKKNYSTKYRYFDNSKTQWPSIRIIEEVQGSCDMIELPVTLRYNFKPTAKHNFFAAAGLSSWIMKKEDYSYNYTTPNNPVQRSMYKSYFNSSRNWFSVLQLSAGWQRNVGRLGAIRVQPYYNMPLSGVGIGHLPVSGLGVLAGFSFNIR